MKLELKHLAPYLHYGLKFATLSDDDDKYYIDKERNTLDFGGLNGVANICMAKYSKQLYKIILRPLSDLTKEIEVDSELTIISEDNTWGRFEEISTLKPHQLRFIQLREYELLLSYHFDVFGLIEQGLAIDINTIK